MSRKVTFKKALDAALARGPCEALELWQRMLQAGWVPGEGRRPEESVYGPRASMNRRLLWRCRHGHAACLLVNVGGRSVNVYAAATGPLREAAERFDLSDPTTRLIAADFVEERGDPVLADLLRRCRRFTFDQEGGEV